jgi:hypothetical protein
MLEIKLTATVDESRRITLDLPADMPQGEVEITVRSLAAAAEDAPGELTREQVRARLLAAGLLVTTPNAEKLSIEEEERLGRLLAGNRTTEELISEDRIDNPNLHTG